MDAGDEGFNGKTFRRPKRTVGRTAQSADERKPAITATGSACEDRGPAFRWRRAGCA
jgi:hypothetical protein